MSNEDYDCDISESILEVLENNFRLNVFVLPF